MLHLVDAAQGFAFGEASYPLGGVFGPLTRRYVTLLLMHEGSVRITCDDTVIVLEEGQCGIFHHERYYLAEYEAGRRDRVGWCEASPASLPEIGFRFRDLPGPVAISERVATLQRFGVETGSESGTSSNMLRNCLGQAVFMTFFHEAQVSEQALHIPRAIKLAKHHIEESFPEDITVTSLADLAAITPQHLISLFHRHVGMTPIRYLWQKRAERGHFLLLQTGLSVAEVAYQCGYKNPFHFSRQMKQHFGLSPKELRANRGYRVPAEVAENTAGRDRLSPVDARGRAEWLGQVDDPRHR